MPKPEAENETESSSGTKEREPRTLSDEIDLVAEGSPKLAELFRKMAKFFDV